MIGFFNQYQIWGGGEKWHYTAAIYMAEKGEDVVVFTHRRGELWERLKRDGRIRLQHIAIDKYSYFNPFSLWSFWRLFRKYKLNSLVFNSQTDVRSAALPAKWAKVPKIIFRAGSPQVIPSKKSYRRTFGSLYKLVPISKAIKDNFLKKSLAAIEGVDLETIIPNAIDFTEFSNRSSQKIYQAKENEIILGHAGRFSKEKGQHYLLEVAKHLNEKNITFKLLLAGKGETEAELKKKVEDYGLGEKVLFVGFLENVKDLIESIDICLFPSEFEGTSSFLVETMALKKPIICFDVSSMPEMVEEGYNGFLVPLGECELFAERVLSLIENSQRRVEMGENGYMMAQERFNQSKNFEQWFRLLTDSR